MFLLVAFALGGFHLGYLLGVAIMEVLGNEFILFAVLDEYEQRDSSFNFFF